MTAAVFLLVVTAAFFHATWNLLLKRSDDKLAFLWLLVAVPVPVFLVPPIVIFALDGISLSAIGFGAGSAFLHSAYSLALARGYHHGDLSIVYPMSRGLSVALIPIGAVLILDERPSLEAVFAIGLVVVGVYAVTVQGRTARDLLEPLLYLRWPDAGFAVLTGVLITGYSLWDKSALDHLSPITLSLFGQLGPLIAFAPIVLKDGAAPVRTEWRRRRWSVFAGGALAAAAYLLVLIALTTGRISYVAPAREIGVVFGVPLGLVILKEGYGPIRIASSALIVVGASALAVAP